MAEIILTRGYVAIVDDEDMPTLSQYRWRAMGKEPHIYAVTGDSDKRRGTKTILMHRLIMNAEDGFVVDHKDDNCLNNRRANLRVCSHRENITRGRENKSKSGFRGVSKQLLHDSYCVKVGGEYVGNFKTAEEAARAYDAAAVAKFGQFARTNEMLGNYDRMRGRR